MVDGTYLGQMECGILSYSVIVYNEAFQCEDPGSVKACFIQLEVSVFIQSGHEHFGSFYPGRSFKATELLFLSYKAIVQDDLNIVQIT